MTLVVVVAVSACAHTPTVVHPIAWPSNATVIAVHSVPTPVEAKATEPSLFLRYESTRIFAQRTDGPSFPLPQDMAAILPGWVDGVRVTWDREACLLGGHIERKTGHHEGVDGGFCFNGETRAWRTVRLSSMPPELRPAHGPTAHRWCQTLIAGNQRVMSCSHRSGGGQASDCGRQIPRRIQLGTYRLVGLR